MDLEIVNMHPQYSKVELIAPKTSGFIHLAAEVHPRPLPFSLLLPERGEKAELLTNLKESAQHLAGQEKVIKATVFDARAIPPFSRFPYIRDHGESIRLARFDVVVLIETTSADVIQQVQATPEYRALMNALDSKSKQVHVMAACNAKRVGDVDETTPGTFLFNYFVADDQQVMLELWDYLAGWYATETGLDNSMLLVPVDRAPSDYLAINFARWDEGPLRFLWQQLSKKSFRNYVQASLTANHVGSMPVLYRLA